MSRPSTLARRPLLTSRLALASISLFVLLAPALPAAGADALAPTLRNVSYGPHNRNVLDFFKAATSPTLKVSWRPKSGVMFNDGEDYTYVQMPLM